MRNLLALLAFLILAPSAFAQTIVFERTYGQHEIVVLSDGKTPARYTATSPLFAGTPTPSKSIAGALTSYYFFMKHKNMAEDLKPLNEVREHRGEIASLGGMAAMCA